MSISDVKQVKKTSDKILDELIAYLTESRDWSELRRGQKIDIELSNPEFLQLFRVYGKRIYTLIESCIPAAIEKFWSARISELIIPTDPEKLKELLYDIADGAEKTRYTLVKQEKIKLALSGKLDWVHRYFSKILSEIKILPGLIRPIPLSQVNATHVDKLVCFDCNIDGVETQQAVEDKYLTEKSGMVFAERYSKDQHGAKRETFYDDFQYYWLREPIKEFSRKKSLRKIAGQSYGKYVGKYETGDKVRILGFYRTINQKGVDELGVEIEIINMERLDDDVEITLSKDELNETWA